MKNQTKRLLRAAVAPLAVMALMVPIVAVAATVTPIDDAVVEVAPTVLQPIATAVVNPTAPADLPGGFGLDYAGLVFAVVFTGAVGVALMTASDRRRARAPDQGGLALASPSSGNGGSALTTSRSGSGVRGFTRFLAVLLAVTLVAAA